jgi:hypothetical protein
MPDDSTVLERVRGAETGTKTGGGQTGGGVREPWDQQPVGPPGDGDDRELLLWLLKTIEDELYRFAFYREPLNSASVRAEYRQVWPEVAAAFESARKSLQQQTTDLQQKLQNAGLKGNMLQMKTKRLWSGLNVYRHALGELSILDPVPAKLGPIEKIRDWVFEVLNDLLGSLAKVFEVLELVKEYKEHLATTVKAIELGMIS